MISRKTLLLVGLLSCQAVSAYDEKDLGVIVRYNTQRVIPLTEESWANLKAADLRGAKLFDADLRGADLKGADLRDANLWEAKLSETNLEEANLEKANLCKANLKGASLSLANLIGANLREATLNRANLIEADLTGADLTGADLTGADLTNAAVNKETNVAGAFVIGAIGFDKAFKNAKGFGGVFRTFKDCEEAGSSISGVGLKKNKKL